MPDSPFERTPEAQKQWERISLHRDLRSGVEQMRTEEYLPAYKKEKEAAHRFRMNQTELKGEFGPTIEGHAGRVFSEPPRIHEGFPDALEPWLQVVDGKSDLQTVARPIFETSGADGSTFVFTDGPLTPDAYPRVVPVDWDQYRGAMWTTEGELKRVWWVQPGLVEKSQFEATPVQFAWVIEQGLATKWMREEGGEAQIARDEDGKEMIKEVPMDHIPFRSSVFGRQESIDSEHMAHSFYDELARKELERFRIYSMVRANLDFHLRSFVHFKNFTPKEYNAIEEWTNQLAIRNDPRSGNEGQADIVIPQPATEGQTRGMEWLDRIDREIALAARRPLLSNRTGQITATEAALSAVIGDATVMRNAETTSRFWGMVAFDAGAWGGTVVDPQNIIVFKHDVGLSQLIDGSDDPVQLQKDGIISEQTRVAEARKRDTLDETVDWETEQRLIKEEEAFKESLKTPEERAEADRMADLRGLADVAIQEGDAALEAGESPEEARAAGLAAAESVS